MIVQAFVIDEATGATLQRVRVPVAGMLDDAQLPTGRRYVIFEGEGDIDEIETAFVGGAIAFLPRAPDESTALTVAQVAKVQALSARFHIEVDAGCPSPKGRTNCDDQAGARITGLIRLVEELVAQGAVSPSHTIDWTMHDRRILEPHNLAELKALGVAIGVGFQAKFSVRQALEQQIMTATSLSELDAIDITAGWPA